MTELNSSKILKNGINLFFGNWRVMVRYILAIWLVEFILVAPPTAWMLHWLSSSGSEAAISNYGIPEWLLTPKGIIYSLLIAIATALNIYMQEMGIFWIADAARKGHCMRARDALRRLYKELPKVIPFSMIAFVAALFMLSVFGVVPLMCRYFLLSQHDINYYLSMRPFEWYLVIGLTSVWAIVCLSVTLMFGLRLNYVLPLWLDYTLSLRQAIRITWQRTRGKVLQLLCVVGVVVVSCIVIEKLVEVLLFFLTSFMLQYVRESVAAISTVIGFDLALSMITQESFVFMAIAWLTSVRVFCFAHHVLRDGTDSSLQLRVQPSYSADNAKKRYLSKRGTVIIVVIFIAFSFLVQMWMIEKEDSFKPPLVIAHRTGAAYAPENSLSGLKVVLEQGVSDYVEIDVQMTLDGEVVVVHDADLMKIASSPLEVKNTEYDDLKKVDIDVQFDPEFEGERVERLVMFLKKARNKIKMLIEFKDSLGTTLVQETIRLVNKYKMEDDVVFASLELDDVNAVQRLAPDIPVGYFASIELGALDELDIDFLAPKDSVVDEELVRRCHENGISVHVWTVDDRVRMLELIELGVDGLITNDPPLARQVINEVAAMGPNRRLLLQFRTFWKIFDKKGILSLGSVE